MFPKAADAVLLEGLCPPDLCRYETFDYNTNAAGLEGKQLLIKKTTKFIDPNLFFSLVLRLCGMDATCINHLGFDVWGAVENLYAMLNNNTLPCQKFLSGKQNLLTKMIPAHQPVLAYCSNEPKTEGTLWWAIYGNMAWPCIDSPNDLSFASVQRSGCSRAISYFIQQT